LAAYIGYKSGALGKGHGGKNMVVYIVWNGKPLGIYQELGEIGNINK
jgi:hypothetical protein